MLDSDLPDRLVLMHRKPLLEMLARYAERWPDEGATVERIRTLVEAHADCFERSCLPGHVTGSAWIVSHDGGSALLVHHRKLNRWLQPGGHADGEADVSAVAVREALEESGIAGLRLVDRAPFDIDVHVIPARPAKGGLPGEPEHEHHDLRFLVVAPQHARPTVSDESHDVRWVDLDRLRDFTDEESVLRLARKAALLLKR